MEHEAIGVRRAIWEQEGETIRRVRTEVFVVEQKVPIELEIDGLDPVCVHVVAIQTTGDAVGTARLLKTGRIAVLKSCRGRGIGSQLVRTLIDFARADGRKIVYLHAQTHAKTFYRKLGFRDIGEPHFRDAGIPHIRTDLTRMMQS
jgi:predicted GNAT family N-acyltransferase